MVSVPQVLPRVKGFVTQILPGDWVDGQAKELGYVYRDRILSPGVLLPLLMQMALLSLALGGLVAGGQTGGREVTASAVCQARARLPLVLLARAIDRMLELGRRESSRREGGSRWRGFELIVTDAMSLCGVGSHALVNRFGRGKNGGKARGAGPAQMKLVAVMDLASGMLRPLGLIPWWAQEAGRGGALLLAALVGHGQLVLADRVYGSYPLVALLIHAGAEVLIRLREDRTGGRPRARVLSGRRRDRLVEWLKPESKPVWLPMKLWKTLPEKLVLREIRYSVRRRGKTTPCWLITSLTDASFPRAELIGLYGRRWEVEGCFRQLKAHCGLGRLRATSVKGAEREAWCAALAYNLVRLAMLKLAWHMSKDVRRVSFVQTLRLLIHGPAVVRPRINPARPGRSCPRKLSRSRKDFPPLRKADRKMTAKPVILT